MRNNFGAGLEGGPNFCFDALHDFWKKITEHNILIRKIRFEKILAKKLNGLSQENGFKTGPPADYRREFVASEIGFGVFFMSLK